MTSSTVIGPKTYMELFGDPSFNPSGTDTSAGYAEILTRWLSDNNPPTTQDVLLNFLTDFESTIGGVGSLPKTLDPL